MAYFPDENQDPTVGPEYPAPWPYNEPDVTPSSPPQSDEERRRTIAESVIRPAYAEILGRDPSPEELQAGIAYYEARGGREFRTYLQGQARPSDGGGGERTPYARFEPPPFDMPAWSAPAPFAYPEFEAPTAETFQADPGYDWRVAEGERALKNFSASQGLLRTGGTLKDLMTWREGLASQEFGNVYNRRFGEWSAGRDTARDMYDRNFQSSVFDYNRQYQAEADEYARALGTYGMNFDVHQGEFSNMSNLYALATRNLPTYQPPQYPTL